MGKNSMSTHKRQIVAEGTLGKKKSASTHKKQKLSEGTSRKKTGQVYNEHLFKSYEHQKRFNNDIKKRNFMLERVILLKPNEYLEVQEMIERKGWEKLVSFPKPAYKEIVRGFYANAYILNPEEDEKFLSYVRGHLIKFDAKTINDFFGIETPKKCKYENMTDGRPQTKEFLNALGRPSAAWEYTAIGKLRRLKATSLKPIPKAWGYFVLHTLDSCANISDLIHTKTQLVYYIIH